MFNRSLPLTLTGVACLGIIATPVIVRAETSNLAATCAFDTGMGKPNPLGMRAYITAVEVNGDTTFTYEQFPANVSGKTGVAATIAQRRMLTFYKTTTAEARELLLQNPAYYAELIGNKDSAGFKPVNDVLRCQTAEGKPLEKSPKIANLPDGTYRFWNGKTRNSNISDAALLKQGGILVVFKKQGSRILGSVSRIDQEAGVCVEGMVAGNTMSGFATTYQALKKFNKSDTFEPLVVIPDGSLKTRRGKQISNDRVRFPSALLNLNGYTKIDTAKSQAPSKCPR
ncbi:hypothetical protein IQ266_18790 [filamentous cyanobacterium LEGE 11480]|uniref:Uncharacterized protein n=1 Tax=Romeriopsis navalis LEGE 11480 TaxID=2777977 RepID=A0A928VNY2_9CYAN|nr:hypothetical protein [Romeriopsis navalis]MBE9031785.1 hypothetical protein [Romeriopsis navalis LEGE 11480]